MYAGLNATLRATRETPQRLEYANWYHNQISRMASSYAVLFDENSRRGWLLDGASVLLHILRSSLAYQKNVKLRPSQETLDVVFGSKLKDGNVTSSPVEFLTDTEIMNMVLFKSPEETETKRKAPLQRGVPNSKGGDVTKTTITRFQCVKDRVNDIYSVLDQIFSYHSHNAITIKTSPRTRLEGVEYLDMAEMATSVIRRYTNLKSNGTGWIDLIRSLGAVTFFGSGFGDILEPMSWVASHSPSNPEPLALQSLCESWKQVPIEEEFLATTTPILRTIMTRSGGMLGHHITPDRQWKLAHDLYIDSPARVFESCQCETAAGKGDKATKLHPSCDRVLAVQSESHIAKRHCRTPERLPEQGAVIFGLRQNPRVLKKVSRDPVKAISTAVAETEAGSSQSNAAESSTTAGRLGPSTLTSTQLSATSSGNSNSALPATRVPENTDVRRFRELPIAAREREEGRPKGGKEWVKERVQKTWKFLHPRRET